MKVLITGATGFIGKDLVKKILLEDGNQVVVLTRNTENAKQSLPYPCEFYEWDLYNELIPQQALNGVDAVIHLAGESVGEGRWTKLKKQKITDSRVFGTQNLMKSLVKYNIKPKVILSASAIGFYGDRGEEILNEDSAVGQGFLPEVCQKWEDEIFKYKNEFERLVAIRIGIVLEKDGGALKKMLPIFKLGVAGKIASGNQWMSWIHKQDVIGLIDFSLKNSQVSGPVNAVAPQPQTNKDFTKTLAKTLGRPAFLPAPAFALKIMLGETSDLVLNSQHVVPDKAKSSGYKFLFEDLESALQDILGKKKA